MANIELEDYILFKNDLERNHAMIVALIGAFLLTESIKIYAGISMEFERNHY